MPPTTYMLMDLPTVGGSVDVWGTLINTLLEQKVDSHDHTTGKGTKVPVGGLAMDADLGFNSHRATGVAGLALVAVGSDPAGARELYSKAPGDLYWNNGAGTHVQLTTGGSINVASVAGIGGDYPSVNALFAYVDASDSYTAQQQIGAGVRQWARLESADLRLYEFKAHPAAGPVPGLFVGLASPAALAASYTLTFPGALPPAHKLALQSDSTGALSFSNSIEQATLTGGAAVNGLLTANGGVTLAANQHVTISGTGLYKHPTVVEDFGPQAGHETAGLTNCQAANGGIAYVGAGTWVVPVPVTVGKTLTSLAFRRKGNAAATITWSADVYKDNAVVTNLGAGAGVVASAWGAQAAFAGARVIAADEYVLLTVQSSAGGPDLGVISRGQSQA